MPETAPHTESRTGPRQDLAAIAPIVRRAREAFDTGRTRPLPWRIEQLHAVDEMLTVAEDDVIDALVADLGKSRVEAYGTDVGFVRADVRHTLRHLRKWARPRRVRAPMLVQPGRAEVVSEPLGVVCVIAPWNYPAHLVLVPLVAAIAAGNAVVVKPSELAPSTSGVLARLIPEYLDDEAVGVVEGGVAETTELLAQRFDHIFFTGSARVGRTVMEAAAKHITPVTLELGGKSPVIVDRTADVRVAARRIVFGKFLNAGQTCVAPDYVLVDRAVEDRLHVELASAVRTFFGAEPRHSPDYARIVNDTHFRRLEKLLGDGTAVVGGAHDDQARYIAPTILRDVDVDSTVMSEEIFGPILPVIAVETLRDAISFVNERDKPLALYVFTDDRTVARRVVAETSSGGVAVNATVMQLSVPDLPFGGVGASGMGAYHGRAGFDTFSHARGVLHRSTRLDAPLGYPPYNRFKEWLIRRFL